MSRSEKDQTNESEKDQTNELTILSIIKKLSEMDASQIITEKKNIVSILSTVTLIDIKSFFYGLTSSNNITLVFAVFHMFLEEKEFDEKDLAILIDICEKCLLYSDELYPLTIHEESGDTNMNHLNIQKNAELTELSLLMFMDFFCFAGGNNNWIRNIKLEEGNMFQKNILKKLGGKLLIVVTSRLGKYEWSNDSLRKVCKDILLAVSHISKCLNISSLIAGTENSLSTWFPDGLFGKVLTELSPYFNQYAWKRVVYIKHVLVWCITKIKFPLLVSHITTVLPFLLQLVDDYETKNKCLGISTIEYVVNNVTPSDLCLLNYADVIYDALFKQLYMNEDQVYEVSLSCLLKVLLVLHPKYNYEIKYTKWDDTLEKVLDNIEYTSKFPTKKILLNYLPRFFTHMGVGLIKHTDRLLSIISLTLEHSDGKDEFCRIYAFKILNETVRQCWPVIFRYENQIIKFLLKFLIDLMVSEHLLCNHETKKRLCSELINSLKLMKLCGGERFQVKLKSIISATVNEKFNSVKDILKISLDE